MLFAGINVQIESMNNRQDLLRRSALIAFVAGLANLGCEPKTTVSHTTTTTTATPLEPVLEGD